MGWSAHHPKAEHLVLALPALRRRFKSRLSVVPGGIGYKAVPGPATGSLAKTWWSDPASRRSRSEYRRDCSDGLENGVFLARDASPCSAWGVLRPRFRHCFRRKHCGLQPHIGGRRLPTSRFARPTPLQGSAPQRLQRHPVRVVLGRVSKKGFLVPAAATQANRWLSHEVPTRFRSEYRRGLSPALGKELCPSRHSVHLCCAGDPSPAFERMFLTETVRSSARYCGDEVSDMREKSQRSGWGGIALRGQPSSARLHGH